MSTKLTFLMIYCICKSVTILRKNIAWDHLKNSNWRWFLSWKKCLSIFLISSGTLARKQVDVHLIAFSLREKRLKNRAATVTLNVLMYTHMNTHKNVYMNTYIYTCTHKYICQCDVIVFAESSIQARWGILSWHWRLRFVSHWWAHIRFRKTGSDRR